MFLTVRETGHLVEVMQPESLYDPCITEVLARSHAGEELQEPEMYLKAELIFPSGEPLPRCWLDSHYRDVKPPKLETAIPAML